MLRLCTSQQNKQNARSHKDSKSKYRGLTWKEKLQKWEVRIQVNHKRIIVGYFVDEIEAAKAYNEKAKEVHGEFAVSMKYKQEVLIMKIITITKVKTLREECAMLKANFEDAPLKDVLKNVGATESIVSNHNRGTLVIK